MQSTELSYRKSAAQGASGLGLMIALYDTLAGDLRRAADAERSNNLEKRCLEVNHALLVIGYLEDAMERASGGDLTKQLVALYSSLRRKLIEAQAKRSPEILEGQMTRVLCLRETWQKVELSVPDAPNTLAGATANREHDDTPVCQPSGSTSWSA
jgi:flagellar biosynthetic protein FliS